MENTREEQYLEFLGCTPPLKIIADRCGDIVVNYKIVINMREEDTLRKEARRIEQEIGLQGVATA